MTEQEVVNIVLTEGYDAIAVNYTRSALEEMYQTIVGSSWGRKSASKHDIAFGVYNYINKMNRAAAFNNDKAYEVHTPEVDGLLACLQRNSDYIVLSYFPDNRFMRCSTIYQ